MLWHIGGNKKPFSKPWIMRSIARSVVESSARCGRLLGYGGSIFHIRWRVYAEAQTTASLYSSQTDVL